MFSNNFNGNRELTFCFMSFYMLLKTSTIVFKLHILLLERGHFLHIVPFLLVVVSQCRGVCDVSVLFCSSRVLKYTK